MVQAGASPIPGDGWRSTRGRQRGRPRTPATTARPRTPRRCLETRSSQVGLIGEQRQMKLHSTNEYFAGCISAFIANMCLVYNLFNVYIRLKGITIILLWKLTMYNAFVDEIGLKNTDSLRRL